MQKCSGSINLNAHASEDKPTCERTYISVWTGYNNWSVHVGEEKSTSNGHINRKIHVTEDSSTCIGCINHVTEDSSTCIGCINHVGEEKSTFSVCINSNIHVVRKIDLQWLHKSKAFMQMKKNKKIDLQWLQKSQHPCD